MKRLCVLLIHFTLVFTVLACDNSAVTTPPLIDDDVIEEIPSLTIKSDDNAIAYVSRQTDSSGNPLDESEEFGKNKIILNMLPYIPLGAKIQLILENGPPMSYTFLDDILNEDGTRKYSQQSTQKVDIQFEDKIGTFVLAPNNAAIFSSNSESYKPGRTIRGFKLLCHWEHESIEYSFIIRTDALKNTIR